MCKLFSLYWYGQLVGTPAVGGLIVCVCVRACVRACICGPGDGQGDVEKEDQLRMGEETDRAMWRRKIS